MGRIGWIGLAGLAELDHNGWMRTKGFCKNGTDGTNGMDGTDGTDGMEGLDGALVGLGWDGRLLTPAGTGAT